MAYDSIRSYLGTFTMAAQNAVSTASGAIVAGTATVVNIPIAEPTWLCSVAGVVTATPSSFPAGVKPFVVIGTTTATGPTAIAQSSGSSAYSTFVPSVAIPSGSVITVGLVSTGTASATQTIGATTVVVGIGPQFV